MRVMGGGQRAERAVFFSVCESVGSCGCVLPGLRRVPVALSCAHCVVGREGDNGERL